MKKSNLHKALVKAKQALLKAEVRYDKLCITNEATVTEDNPEGLHVEERYEAYCQVDDLREKVAEYSGILEAVKLIPDALFTNHIKADVNEEFGELWLRNLTRFVANHTPYIMNRSFELSAWDDEICKLLEERFKKLKAAHKRKRIKPS
jgi:hypothetical protein